MFQKYLYIPWPTSQSLESKRGFRKHSYPADDEGGVFVEEDWYCKAFPFGWIAPGAKVRWADPGLADYDASERLPMRLAVRKVWRTGGAPVKKDDIVTLSDEHGEAEVYAHELRPIGPHDGMTVWIVIRDEFYDGAQTTSVLGTFTDRKDARECLRHSMRADRENAAGLLMENTADSYSFYEQGRHCENHIDAFVEESRINVV